MVGALNWEEPARALRRVRVVPGPLVSAPAASAAAAAAAAAAKGKAEDKEGKEEGAGKEEPIVQPAHFDWLLVQRVGGRADGVWFTASLTRSEFEKGGGGETSEEEEEEEEGGRE